MLRQVSIGAIGFVNYSTRHEDCRMHAELHDAPAADAIEALVIAQHTRALADPRF